MLCAVSLLSGCSAEKSAALPSSVQNKSAEGSADASLSADESKSTELFAMDTVMNLTAYGPNAPGALDAAAAEINRLDDLLSISSENGEIMKINRDGEGSVSPDVEALLDRALDFSRETDGLFDCTIEPVMEAWGFTDQDYRIPSEEELKLLLSKVDSDQVQLTDGEVKLPPDVRLDLGGIAKGFTSARIMDIFAENGITSGLVSLGGNVQALGHKPDGSLWRIGIQDPNNLDDIFATVEIADQAVITSGPYQRYFEENGVRYHHIIDPRTGYPADSGLISVTIISSDGTLADALSTSLYIMGPDRAASFWKEHQDQFDAIMMTNDGTVLVTSGLADHCTIQTGGAVQVIS